MAGTGKTMSFSYVSDHAIELISVTDFKLVIQHLVEVVVSDSIVMMTDDD